MADQHAAAPINPLAKQLLMALYATATATEPADHLTGQEVEAARVLLARYSPPTTADALADQLIEHLHARANGHSLTPAQVEAAHLVLSAVAQTDGALHGADIARRYAQGVSRCR